MPGMKVAKSPAPTPVRVAIEPTSIAPELLVALDEVEPLVVVVVAVLDEFEQAASATPQASATASTTTAPLPRVRPCRDRRTPGRRPCSATTSHSADRDTRSVIRSPFVLHLKRARPRSSATMSSFALMPPSVGHWLLGCFSAPGGVLVMRLYVRADINGAGTGGVPLPTIGFVDQAGKEISLDQATGNPAIDQVIASCRDQHGKLPAALTQNYPPPAPVPAPVTSPTPVGGITYGTGPYANPDKIYEHIAYTTTSRPSCHLLACSSATPTANGRAGAAPRLARLWQPPAECRIQGDRVHRAIPHDRHIRGLQQLTFDPPWVHSPKVPDHGQALSRATPAS